MFQWLQAWLLFRKMKLCDDAVPLLTSPAEYSLTTLLSAFTSTKRCGKNVKAEYSLTTLLSAFTLWPVHPITMEAKVKIVVICLFITKSFRFSVVLQR